MKINFNTNDYLLTWNLLYGASISEAVHLFKQKLWNNYKKQYNAGMKEKEEMLSDIKNYIPNDETLYNLVTESTWFNKIKEETENHRVMLLKIWDENKKDINKNLKEILRFNLKDNYNVLVLHPKMDTTLLSKNSNTICWGYKKDLEDKFLTITNIIYTLIKEEIGEFEKSYKEIVQAVLELAIKTELYARISGESNNLDGDKSLIFLKKQIYPYFLMYLGCDKEDMTHYMRRDRMAFDIDRYTIEKALKKIDLYEFIKFCIKNQKHIIRINNLEII